jgi:hypothetical protein
MKRYISAVIWVLAVVMLPGCDNQAGKKQASENAADAPAATTQPATEATPALAYICPMECEGSASYSPGKCPVCGMDLVKNPKHTATTPDSTNHTAR